MRPSSIVRLGFALVVLALVFCASTAGVALRQGPPAASLKSAMLVYVGTYTGAKTNSQGIYYFRFETGSGPAASPTLVPLGLAAETISPSYLDVDAKRRLLFAVNETNEFEGKPTGAVSVFRIEADGKLTLLNQRPSMGRGPCYIVLDKEGRNVLVANYGSGSVAVLPVGADGRLGEPTAVVQHTGSSVNPSRQKGPHAHCMAPDPANRFVFACDLGLDQVLTYRYDAARGTLTASDPPFTAVKPGAGPRAMVFRPDGRFAYLGNEMHSTVTVFAYDADRGALREIQTLSALPAGFEGSSSIAEVAMHPSGRFLYVSNRGRDSVALFTIDQATGRLTYVQDEPSGGRTPRHFGIAPSGQHLIMANQNSNTLLPARIDQATGRLTPAGPAIEAPAPVFVAFFQN